MGARRERECSRGTGGGDTGIGGPGEWLRSRASSNGRGGRWPSRRVAERFRQFSPIRLHGVLNGSSAASGWSQGRICAGNGRGAVRIGRHGQEIAEERPILRLGLARLVLPHSIALPPGVLGKTLGSGAARNAGRGEWRGTERRARPGWTQGAPRGTERRPGPGSNAARVRSPGRGRAPVHRRTRGRR